MECGVGGIGALVVSLRQVPEVALDLMKTLGTQFVVSSFWGVYIREKGMHISGSSTDVGILRSVESPDLVCARLAGIITK